MAATDLNKIMAAAMKGAEVAATAALLRLLPPASIRDAAMIGAGRHLMRITDTETRRAVALGIAHEAVQRVAYRVGAPL